MPTTACGGNQTVHFGPIDCQGSSLIDGTFITAHVVESGGKVTATYTLDQPRQADTAIRIRWHVGISSTNPPPVEQAGVIPAGETVGQLSVTSPVCAGQLDVKAVFIANGDSRGHVTGPWITDTQCQVVTTTTTTPATTTTTVPGTTTTVPGTTTTTPVVTTTTVSVVPHPPLPATGGEAGSNTDPIAGLAVGILLVGALFIASTKRGGAWIVRKFGR